MIKKYVEKAPCKTRHLPWFGPSHQDGCYDQGMLDLQQNVHFFNVEMIGDYVEVMS